MSIITHTVATILALLLISTTTALALPIKKLEVTVENRPVAAIGSIIQVQQVSNSTSSCPAAGWFQHGWKIITRKKGNYTLISHKSNTAKACIAYSVVLSWPVCATPITVKNGDSIGIKLVTIGTKSHMVFTHNGRTLSDC